MFRDSTSTICRTTHEVHPGIMVIVVTAVATMTMEPAPIGRILIVATDKIDSNPSATDIFNPNTAVRLFKTSKH